MRVKSVLFSMLMVLATFLGSFPPLFTATGNAATTEAIVDPFLLQAINTSEGAVEVIVTFKGDGAPTESQIMDFKQLGISSGIAMKSLPMAGVLATAEQIEKLKQNPDVRSLYLNRPLQYYNYEATALTGVDKVRADAPMTKQNGGLPVSGKGVTVVVNDSGVDGTHKDIEYGKNLIQNVMGTTNLNALSDLLPVTYVENVINTDVNSGHGTHVAGTVGGTGMMSNGKQEGVAPGANLIGYGSGAALFILDSIGGFDYALTHQFEYGIRVITNSWGSSGDFDPENPVNVASKMAYDRGIVVLFAAGNDGPGENTHNPYAKAPWVISVAAGDKQGKLADFSSRGSKGAGGSFNMDGETWTWIDQPSITAPGVGIISTRVIAPVSSLAAQEDVGNIEPANLPYYTMMSGTSMATPHVAGIVALLLEANPQLSPDEVKQILQDTATNIPGMEPWEVGAGYVNAYAAVDRAFYTREYGKTLISNRSFNSNVNISVTRTPFTVDYNPITLASNNQYTFTVPNGLTELVARVDAYGILESGNPLNLILIAPDGTEYSSGISLLFALYFDRTVSVTSPMPGEWKVELRGLRGDEANPTNGASLPEMVEGVLTFKTAGGFSGLNDISGHPAEDAIKIAVSERLVDGYSDRSFKPDQVITRKELANYLVMGAGIRQYLPSVATFNDVSAENQPFIEAVTAKGAALKDRFQTQNGVMFPTADGTFSPKQAVTRAALAYSLVQSLGFQEEALARNDSTITVQYGDQRIAIEDEGDIPKGLEGYVQVALDMNILNAYFTVSQGPFDLQPTVHAVFKPTQKVTRGEFAVAMTRFYATYLMP